MNWFLLDLSENQIVALTGDLKRIYDDIEAHNRVARLKEGDC